MPELEFNFLCRMTRTFIPEFRLEYLISNHWIVISER